MQLLNRGGASKSSFFLFPYLGRFIEPDFERRLEGEEPPLLEKTTSPKPPPDSFSFSRRGATTKILLVFPPLRGKNNNNNNNLKREKPIIKSSKNSLLRPLLPFVKHSDKSFFSSTAFTKRFVFFSCT